MNLLHRWHGQALALPRRHPIWRETLVWLLPALLIGAAWRLLLVSYLPYANWNADSRSYYSFAHTLMAHGKVSLYEKRRYLYPIFLLPVTWLPGASLRWLAWIQHALGWVSLLPLGYIIRRTLVAWKLWIVPVTVIYASLPMFLWFERELLAETLFFDLLVWAMAGWVAWALEPRPERAARLFWWLFVPLALFIATKPAGKFFWPGLALGLLLLARQRRIRPVEWASLFALVLFSTTVGAKSHGSWLLYVSSFPLTNLESPLHADYKAQIADRVREYRAHLDSYYGDDGWAFEFLRDPEKEPDRPLWAALHGDEKRMGTIYLDLAKEAIRSHPWLYLRLGLSRWLASANPSNFNPNRFRADFYRRHFEHFYNEEAEGEKTPLRELFGLPARGALPPYEEFSRRLAPLEEPWAARALIGWSRAFCDATDLVRVPPGKGGQTPSLLPPRLTFLGWCLLAGAACSWLPRYRSTLGVWAVATFGYLWIVFQVTIANARYFDLAWPVLSILFVLPGDWLVTTLQPWWRQRRKAKLEPQVQPALRPASRALGPG